MARRTIEENMRVAANIKTGDQLTKFKALTVVKEIPIDQHFGGTFALQYNFDGTYLVAGFSGGGIRMFSGKSGDYIRELRPNRHGGQAVMCLRFHPKDHTFLYAATAEGSVFLINVETAELKPVVSEPGNQINALDFNVDGFNFCTCGSDLTVRVYQTKSNKMEKSFVGRRISVAGANNESGNTMRVYALKFHPENENIFLSAGWDNHIKIWDLRTSDGIKRQIHGPHICGDALDLRDRNILSGSWCANHALQEWDYGEGKLIREIKFPCTSKGAFLYAAQYCDLGCVLAGGSGTDSVEAIEAGTDLHLGTVPMKRAVQCMDCALGGRAFAVGGGDPFLKIGSLTG